ncbi:hypothetical protein KC323_g1 [Hortaea werneckii]|nr:hypothetical protein KC323_g1 [Hortaea werneckii]
MSEILPQSGLCRSQRSRNFLFCCLSYFPVLLPKSHCSARRLCARRGMVGRMATNTNSSIPPHPPIRSALPRSPPLAPANIDVDGLGASLRGTSSRGGRVVGNGGRFMLFSVRLNNMRLL